MSSSNTRCTEPDPLRDSSGSPGNIGAQSARNSLEKIRNPSVTSENGNIRQAIKYGLRLVSFEQGAPRWNIGEFARTDWEDAFLSLGVRVPPSLMRESGLIDWRGVLTRCLDKIGRGNLPPEVLGKVSAWPQRICHDSHQAIWEVLDNVAATVMDRVRGTEYTTERKFLLMDKRYEDALRQKSVTIMASNEDPRNLDGYLADRIHDGRFLVIKMGGSSGRKLATDYDWLSERD